MSRRSVFRQGQHIHGIFELVAAEEFTFLCVLAIAALIGPWALSLDALTARDWFGDRVSRTGPVVRLTFVVRDPKS